MPPGATINKDVFQDIQFTGSVDGGVSPGPDDRPQPPPIQSNVLGGGKSGSNVKPAELPGKNVGREKYLDSSDDLLFGFNGSVSLVYDLNEAGTFYAEAWGRYHWSEDLTLRNRLGSSEIDMSGFEGGIGVGVRF